MDMNEFNNIKPGDAVKVRVATRNGHVEGWRFVKLKLRTFIEVKAQGQGNFVVLREEILAMVPKGQPIPEDFNVTVRRAAREMFKVLEWITRCPSINGPAGTTAYIITDDIMADAKKAVKHAKGEA